MAIQAPRDAVGITYLPRAAHVLASNRFLWKYVAGPLALNLVVGGALTVVLVGLGWQGVDHLLAMAPDWLAAVGPVLRVVLAGLVLYGVGLLVGRVGVVLGAPFYAALAERIELMNMSAEDLPDRHGGILTEIGRAFLFELKKLAMVLGVGALALAANLVPVAGQFAGLVAGGGLAVLLVCLDAFDPPLERRRYRFRQKVGVVFKNLPIALGFGIPAAFLAGVPFLNLLAFPLIMAAGTLIYCERLHR
jgi:CysZ protein